MTIAYKDFFPEIVEKKFFSKKFESVAATVERANEWIASSGLNILNVETVVLPNIEHAEDASEVGIRTSGEIGSYWYQVVRIWYEAPDQPA